MDQAPKGLFFGQGWVWPHFNSKGPPRERGLGEKIYGVGKYNHREGSLKEVLRGGGATKKRGRK